MRKLLITLAAASVALVTTAPASAQGYYGGYGQRHYGHHGDYGLVRRFDQQIGNLQHRIERSARRGAISRGEYYSLSERAANLRHRLYRFARNGLSHREAQAIAQRIENVRHRLREDRHDGRRYRDGYNRGW